MAWVVGLIIPILLRTGSVNQRLPSGPAVIPMGLELAVGTGNSVMVIDSRQRSSSPSSRGRVLVRLAERRRARAVSRPLAAWRKAGRSPRAAVPGCMFDGVMRKFLSWVGVERITARHRSPGADSGPRVASLGGLSLHAASESIPEDVLQSFFVLAGFADFATGSFARHASALSFLPVAVSHPARISAGPAATGSSVR